ATVTSLFQQLENRHAGETVVYASHDGCMGANDLCKVRIKNGVITSIEPDDLVNPTVPREDNVLSSTDILKGRIRGVPAQQQYAFPYWLNNPNRILYPMKRVAGTTRGDYNGQFVQTTWDDALSIIANEVTQLKSQYGPYSIWARGFTLAGYTGVGISYYGNASYGAEEFAWKFCFNTTGGPSPYITDVLNSKLIVLWPYDPTTNMGCDFRAYYFRLAK